MAIKKPIKPTGPGQQGYYEIDASCISCGACEDECNEDAISEDDHLEQYWIEPEKCTGCGACAEVCPVEAISRAE